MNGFLKSVIALIALGIALTPTWLWLFAYHIFAPQGFWQKFILGVAALWFLGGVQILLFIIWLFIVAAIVES